MKKETIVAISVGAIFGIALALIVVLKTATSSKTKVIPIAPDIKNAPATAAKNNKTTQSFKITEPEDSIVTDRKAITIKGTATKGSLIIIQSPIKNVSLKNDKEAFSTEFPLALGENIINIAVYSPDGNGASEERLLTIYSIEE